MTRRALHFALTSIVSASLISAALAQSPDSKSTLLSDILSGRTGLSDVKVVAPPESFFEKYREGEEREIAQKFYKKFVDVGGLSLAASGDVADEALQRTHYLVTHLLAGRPDVLGAMQKTGTRLIIIGKDQVYTDMPEYRNSRNPTFQNERVRGTGGFRVTSFGEENLLNLPIDRYDDESIGLHEFCHTIDAAIGSIDPTWRGRLSQTYRNAVEKGRWKFAYTGSNQAEYWAEICQSYFDTNRINNWNHQAVATREQLKEYDPEGYELVRVTFNLSPENDFRYVPLRKQPSVISPPEKFHIDAYYPKFTWAREFIVLGTPQTSDEALLKANDTIRKMFAYRHDILKALINDGTKMVVLGPGQSLADLPEFKEAKTQAGFDNARYFDYTPDKKLLVVPEENILGGPADPFRGESSVVRAMAKAAHFLCGSRDHDPKFDTVGGGTQQYEQQLVWNKGSIPIKRLDVEFDLRLRKLYDESMAKGLWKGTPASRGRTEYWAAGVEAYFDAAGPNYPPTDPVRHTVRLYDKDDHDRTIESSADIVVANRPINTREALKAYDPLLYALVDETMLYTGHQDWRYKPNQ